MSYLHSHRIPTPGASRKRKEREPFYYSSKSPASAQPQVAAKPASKTEESVCPNRLLAGYMAHEFLTKGTLFGQKFGPDRAETAPLSAGGASSRGKQEAEPGSKREHKSYAEVASILKTQGAHIPGIFNPSQLASWIQR